MTGLFQEWLCKSAKMNKHNNVTSLGQVQKRTTTVQYYWTGILDTSTEIEQEMNASWSDQLEYVVRESGKILKLQASGFKEA